MGNCSSHDQPQLQQRHPAYGPPPTPSSVASPMARSQCDALGRPCSRAMRMDVDAQHSSATPRSMAATPMASEASLRNGIDLASPRKIRLMANQLSSTSLMTRRMRKSDDKGWGRRTSHAGAKYALPINSRACLPMRYQGHSDPTGTPGLTDSPVSSPEASAHPAAKAVTEMSLSKSQSETKSLAKQKSSGGTVRAGTRRVPPASAPKSASIVGEPSTPGSVMTCEGFAVGKRESEQSTLENTLGYGDSDEASDASDEEEHVAGALARGAHARRVSCVDAPDAVTPRRFSTETYGGDMAECEEHGSLAWPFVAGQSVFATAGRARKVSAGTTGEGDMEASPMSPCTPGVQDARRDSLNANGDMEIAGAVDDAVDPDATCVAAVHGADNMEGEPCLKWMDSERRRKFIQEFAEDQLQQGYLSEETDGTDEDDTPTHGGRKKRSRGSRK